MNLRLVGIKPLVAIDWWRSTSELVVIKPREGHETCDRCGREIQARYVHFDGASFLCVACRQQAPQAK